MVHIINPVILCGGSGTRLWPLSTPEHPKQFMPLISEKSMIQETVLRFATSKVDALAFKETLIVGSSRHVDLLESNFPNGRKILEPFGRNSAPAVAAACLAYDPGDLILILPADHDIKEIRAFHEAITSAADFAQDGDIVTFGIKPTHPATEYGYIKVRSDASGPTHSVEAFVEKPSEKIAKSYLATGSFYWNAGIFLFRADTMTAALAQHAPDVLHGVKQAMAAQTGQRTIQLDANAFEKTPNISIDYAVLEKAGNIKIVPVDMGWSDVGGYRALHHLLSASETENYLRGPVLVEHSEGMYVRSEGPVVTVNGVSNLAIVATNSEVMITPIEQDGAVKSLGYAAQTHRHKLGFSRQRLDAAKAWLWNAFDIWSVRAWDSHRGGFVEQLAIDGTPDVEQDRRVRVQARQIFAFSKAIDLGWPNKEKATELVNLGLDYLDTKLRHPSGGWVHIASADGQPCDDRRYLYDHAFIVLAGASAFKATNNPLAAQIAREALTFIETEMKDTRHGGWIEVLPHTLPRRSNPHMHLLEAMMTLYQATGSDVALGLSGEVVRLFETKFFDPSTDILAEAFEQDWRCTTSPAETVFEPGHHYEWATLLHQYESLTGHDTLSWRRRLIRKADRLGRNSRNGFAFNLVRSDGEVTDSSSRLWHQLEMFRSHLMHPDVSSITQTESLFDQIFENFLNVGPAGGWIDELDARGHSYSGAVPASMLYHCVTALAPLIKS